MSWLKKAIPPKIKNILGRVKKIFQRDYGKNVPHARQFFMGLI